MKIKIVIAILAIVCAALAIGIFVVSKQKDDQHQTDISAVLEFSNQLVSANQDLNELHQVNLALTNDLSSIQQELNVSRQQADELSNSLASAASTLDSTRTSLASARDQIASLNTHITDLETQNKVLDQRANDLTNTIAQLSASIENTQNQLAIAETNRTFIEAELQKQLAQKAELEHRFNDLDELRGQVRKIKDELFVARRLQLMKNDTGNKKGAELLMQRNVIVTNSPTGGANSNYNLNVEVGSDGSVRVIPPIGATNSAAH